MKISNYILGLCLIVIISRTSAQLTNQTVCSSNPCKNGGTCRNESETSFLL